MKQLLYALVVLIALTFLLLWWLKFTTNHGQSIEVPNLSKMTLDKVEEVLDDSDLRYEIMDSANYNPDFPRYSVIEQVPKAGHLVKENRKIYLALNPSGYAKIGIPQVKGKTLRQAEPTLLAMGFKIGKISKRPHISDQVLELRHNGSKIEVGDAIEKTSEIDIIVGDGSLNRVQEDENIDEN
ncbi:PASTA domain-containing protein [Patiriisocius marinistellae]|uniref:PASTA domain-containing protein n=1 Tax=Patiriisocius marinistellae TaxID=2494560 RepID=UPI0028051731|nr:PASTA domain-containing protein [Patiriisocius marinistellae]